MILSASGQANDVNLAPLHGAQGYHGPQDDMIHVMCRPLAKAAHALAGRDRVSYIGR